jgi:hypothetical protein
MMYRAGLSIRALGPVQGKPTIDNQLQGLVEKY